MFRLRSAILVAAAASAACLTGVPPASAHTASRGLAPAAQPAGARSGAQAYGPAALARGIAPLAKGAPNAGNARDDATLLGVSCTSTTYCASVGFNFSRVLRSWPGLSEFWWGTLYTTWKSDQLGPFFQKADFVTFPIAVSCGSAGSCVTVGEHYSSGRRVYMMSASGGGGLWDPISWNNPSGVKSGGLDTVSCVGTWCMTAGWYDGYARGSRERSFAEDFDSSNATSWHRVKTPPPTGSRWSELAGVSCLSSADCVAVGDYRAASGRVLSFADQWNGAGWTITRTPNVRGEAQSIMQDVSCPDASTCVAVGNTDKPHVRPFAETWTAGAWRLAALPDSAKAGLLFSVSCPSTTMCVAVGGSGRAPLAEMWNGTSWTLMRPVRTTGTWNADAFTHVSCVSTTHCVAVGYRYQPGKNYRNHTLIEMWNGQSWRVQRSANP